MQNTNFLQDISARLIASLLTIPFPYRDILHAQIQASSFENTLFPDYFAIRFTLRNDAPSLPQYIDTMPLSWQIITDNAPYLCQLFTKEGYIDSLEIINMQSGNIEWDKVWSTAPMLDYEYSIPFISNIIESGKLEIRQAIFTRLHIDFALTSNGKFFVASFRNCNIRRLPEKFSDMYLLHIREKKTKGYPYTVSSCNGEIDFDCTLIFLQWHKNLSES